MKSQMDPLGISRLHLSSHDLSRKLHEIHEARMGTNPGLILSAPASTPGHFSQHMPIRAQLKGIIIKETSASQKVDSLVIPKGKDKT